MLLPFFICCAMGACQSQKRVNPGGVPAGAGISSPGKAQERRPASRSTGDLGVPAAAAATGSRPVAPRLTPSDSDTDRAHLAAAGVATGASGRVAVTFGVSPPPGSGGGTPPGSAGAGAFMAGGFAMNESGVIGVDPDAIGVCASRTHARRSLTGACDAR